MTFLVLLKTVNLNQVNIDEERSKINGVVIIAYICADITLDGTLCVTAIDENTVGLKVSDTLRFSFLFLRFRTKIDRQVGLYITIQHTCSYVAIAYDNV